MFGVRQSWQDATSVNWSSTISGRVPRWSANCFPWCLTPPDHSDNCCSVLSWAYGPLRGPCPPFRKASKSQELHTPECDKWGVYLLINQCTIVGILSYPQSRKHHTTHLKKNKTQKWNLQLLSISSKTWNRFNLNPISSKSNIKFKTMDYKEPPRSHLALIN